MVKGQKRGSTKPRSAEIARVLSSPEQEASERNGVEFKIKLPKHYRTCHLFDGSIAKAIYLRPSGVPGRSDDDGIANNDSVSG